MSVIRRCLGYAICLTGFSCGILRADSDGNYLSQVKPLLKGRCYACHGSLKQEGGLRLDTAKFALQGGDSGLVIEPGKDVAESVLLQRVSSPDTADRMPPEHEGEPFNKAEIEILKKWIAAGAPAPAQEAPEASPEDHWSFRPLTRPELPKATNSVWVRNPIDVWVAAGHQSHGLTPQKEAERITLLRRLTIDLIGLPPTAEEIAACEADSSADWYEKTVERLLEDPRHGERWARHWMDVWRFSDSWGLGAQARNSAPHMWHFRDWIVENLNKDTSYAKMVRLMLAADEIAPCDPDDLRASGFLARNFFLFNRVQWLDETVEHVSKGFLGLTMNCAKCHDHKYDPLSQVEYYQFRAFFEPYLVRMDQIPGEPDAAANGIPRAFDGLLDAPTYRFIRGDESRPDQSTRISPKVPHIAGIPDVTIQPVTLPLIAWQPGLQQWVLDRELEAAQKRLQDAEQKRDQAAAAIQKKFASSEANNAAASSTFHPVHDTFAAPDLSRWEASGDHWTYVDGKLRQNRDGAIRSTMTLKSPPPRDFDATIRFKTLGGSRWRSVGLTFDQDANTSRENGLGDGIVVYLSAAEGASKLQGALTLGGKSQYPADANKPRKVELQTDYELRVQARGTLVNVALNGEPVLQWRIPVERRAGVMQLMTFDALVEFSEFKLSALSDSAVLIESNQAVAATPEEALALAEADFEVAQADLESVQARVLASIAQREQHAESERKDTSRAAIQLEQQHAVAKAKRNLLAAEQEVHRASDKKKAESEKKLAAAKKALEEAIARVSTPIADTEEFTHFSGASWIATRFLHTGSDDPHVDFPPVSSGRRTALANWITDPRNPLTARVAVNHLWNRHFGQPLAPVTFDLGRSGPGPAYPELIDWLAMEFIDNDWSMKHLHRLIVNSATYRMSSSVAGCESNARNDPDNRFLWRRSPNRMESQVVRDTVLALSGTLDLTRGGPSVPMNEQEQSRRRSLYFYHSNNDRSQFLTTFDEASVTECYQRDQSIVPQQALALTNSGLILDSVPKISAVISGTCTDDSDFVRQSFRVVLGINPSEGELADSLQALHEWKSTRAMTLEQSRSLLIWVLLNHNDFVTVR